MIEWHHLFGMALKDLFTDTKYDVDVEKELDIKQFVDIVVIEEKEGDPISDLPDGLEKLARYNLITYKSLRQPLDSWAIDELLGYYVLFRKLVSPSYDDLYPTDDFHLFGFQQGFRKN
ncbi:hypothetical protein MHK_009805 [Candidatus Magnetomorum sp. HK-1]|nr:hypothetical protein MHK_009805 [Candidatus Magnetomorum sp. HK-1]